MLEFQKCNLCLDDSYDVLHPCTFKEDDSIGSKDLSCSNLGHGKHHRIVRCKKCGLIYSNPREKLAQIKSLYKEVKDDVYQEAFPGRVRTFEKIFHRPEMKAAGKNLLDIGCYTGLFLKLALKKGFTVLGVEPSYWAAQIGREKYGLKIINADIYEAKIDRKFDTICMWDVLEHLPDPNLALNICHNMLSENGILAISTMRCEGAFYSFCGRYWPWFMRMHLFYFTTNSLTAMLEKNGFKVIAVYPYTHYISLDYLLYKATSINKKLSIIPSNDIMKRIIFPVQMGDFMEVYAIRSTTP